MQLPIPDDWNGEDWFCAQVRWPDSPQWTALLVGFLSAASRGRFWDAETGSILDVQAIGRDIFAANFPFNDCDDGQLPPDDEIPDDEIVDAIIGGVCMECSIPYGALRYIDGVLAYRYCGEWYTVEGDRIDDDWGDPGDPDIGDPPEEREVGTPCSKATAYTDVVFGAIGILLAQAIDDVNPIDGLTEVQNTYPSIVWGTTDLFSAYLSAYKLALAVLGDDVTAPDIQQEMLCEVARVVSGGDQGMTEDEYTAAKTAVEKVAAEHFTFAQYGIFDIEAKNLYRKAGRAIGKNDTRKLTTMIAPNGEDCTCPGDEEPDVPSGDIYFTGAYWFEALNGVTVDSVVLSQNHRRISVTMTWPAGAAVTGGALNFGIWSTSKPNVFETFTWPEPGGYQHAPASEWQPYPVPVLDYSWFDLLGITEQRNEREYGIYHAQAFWSLSDNVVSAQMNSTRAPSNIESPITATWHCEITMRNDVWLSTEIAKPY